MFVGNVNEVVKHRYLLREHKKKLLEIVVHRSKDSSKIEDHQNLQYMLNKTTQINSNYKLKTEKECILKENKRVLKNLLKICDHDKEWKQNNKFTTNRAVTYDEIKNKLVSSRLRDRKDTMNGINNQNITLSRKLVSTQSNVSKAKFEKLWTDKKMYQTNPGKFDMTGEVWNSRVVNKMLSTTTTAPRTIYDKIGYNEEPIEIRFSSIPPLRTQKVKHKTTERFVRKKVKEGNRMMSDWRYPAPANRTTGFESRSERNECSGSEQRQNKTFHSENKSRHGAEKYSVHSFMPNRGNVFRNEISDECNKSLETAVFRNGSNNISNIYGEHGAQKVKSKKTVKSQKTTINTNSNDSVTNMQAKTNNSQKMNSFNSKRANTSFEQKQNQQERNLDSIEIDKKDIDIEQQPHMKTETGESQGQIRTRTETEESQGQIRRNTEDEESSGQIRRDTENGESSGQIRRITETGESQGQNRTRTETGESQGQVEYNTENEESQGQVAIRDFEDNNNNTDFRESTDEKLNEMDINVE